MAVEIPLDWNPGYASWPGASSQPTVDTAMRQVATDLAALAARVESGGIQGKLDSLIANYNLHIAAAGVHLEADTTNVITSPVANDPTTDVLALVNDAYDMYVAHIAEAATVHPGGADGTNLITATYPATTEAEGIALMNDIKAQYELHRANNGGAYHTNPDATNTIVEADATDWDDLVTLANGFKNTTGFNAHVVLTAGPTHGSSDAAHAITAADAGAQITALYTEINECKTDLNAHIASLGPHVNPGTANATAAATTEATAVALINGLKTTANVHFASAPDHQDADTTTIAAADATEYEDILTLVAAFRAAYVAHRGKTTVHAKADAVNVETTLGTGGAVTIGLTQA